MFEGGVSVSGIRERLLYILSAKKFSNYFITA